MPEIARLIGVRDWIDLELVERERTPESLMAVGIQSHVAGLSLSNTVEVLETLGVQRSQKAVHEWGQKADLQPESGRSPNQIALDETVIPTSNFGCTLLAIPKRTICFTSGCFRPPRPHSPKFFSANCAIHTMSNPPCSSLMARNTSELPCNEQVSDFRPNVTAIGMPSNESVEN